LKTSIKNQNEYIFSDVIISRQSNHRIPCRCLLSPNDPDAHGKVKVMPGGVSFYKEQEHFPPTYLRDKKPKKDIEGFSKASQRNFRNTLMGLDLKPFFCESEHAEENNGFFISLGWPNESKLNKYGIASDLEKLSKKLRKDFSDSFSGAIWKKELQRQGTPHIHIIVFFNDTILSQDLREWAEDTWASIIGERLPYGADTRPLYGIPEQLINYILKEKYYNAGALCVGRIWGMWNKNDLPFVEPEIYGLNEEDFAELIIRLKGTPQAAHSKLIPKFNNKWKGGRVVGDGDILRKLLEDLPSDDGIYF
jgi:hypothetical protein